MLKIFIGYDHRQPVSYTALQQSIIEHTTKPVSITPLQLNTLSLKRAGLTPFTYSRFLVPYLNNYEGWALFLDIDMVVLDDISKLFDLADDRYTVQVIKNAKRFEWASVMLFNCSKCQVLTPDYVEIANNLHTIGWCNDDQIGSLPDEWNHLVGYDAPRTNAKLVHYTQGIPAYPETIECEYSQEWHNYLNRSHSTLPWDNLMAHSVHAVKADGVSLPKFMFDEQTGKAKPEYNDLALSLIKEKKQWEVENGHIGSNAVANSG